MNPDLRRSRAIPWFQIQYCDAGDTEEELDGTQLSAEWTFSSLQKFGQEFLKKLNGKKFPNKLLEKVGVVAMPKNCQSVTCAS